MQSVERHQPILDMLEMNDHVQVADLVDRFAVSEMTIRRDLDVLEREVCCAGCMVGQ